jgi:predicted Zn-dependent protease
MTKSVLAAVSVVAALAFASPAWAIAGVDFPTYNFKECQKAVDAGDFKKALPMVSELSKFEPENPEVLSMLGYVQRNNGMLTEAMASYNKALALKADHMGALEYQGELFLKLNDKASAEANLAKLKTICPTGCEAHDVLQAAIERAKDGEFQWTPQKGE